MYQPAAKHPLSPDMPSIDDDVFASMWDLFVHIGKFWGNMDDASPLRSELYSFMLDRIKLRPTYDQYYACAHRVMHELVRSRGAEQAYEYLFTDPDANQSPPETPVAVTRQMVANEFIALQLCLGGFKAFGALNYCGYIGGANIPHVQIPYRTFEQPAATGADQ